MDWLTLSKIATVGVIVIMVCMYLVMFGFYLGRKTRTPEPFFAEKAVPAPKNIDQGSNRPEERSELDDAMVTENDFDLS